MMKGSTAGKLNGLASLGEELQRNDPWYLKRSKGDKRGKSIFPANAVRAARYPRFKHESGHWPYTLGETQLSVCYGCDQET